MQRAVEPAVGGGFQAGCARFHEILRVEMRARRVGRTGGVHDRQMMLIPEWLQRGHRGMQAEETVEVEDILARDVDGGAHIVIRPLAMRHHDVQPVGSAALKDDNQAFGPCSRLRRTIRCARQKTRDCGGADNSQSAVAKKYATCDGHSGLQLPVPSTQYSVPSTQYSVFSTQYSVIFSARDC